MFRSLRMKLALSHALVLTVILLAIGGVGQALLAKRLDDSATGDVVNAAHAAAEQIKESGIPGGSLDIDVPSQAAIKVAVFDYSTYQLIGEATGLPSWLTPIGVPLRDFVRSGETVRLASATVQAADGRRLLVVAGRSLRPEQDLLGHVRELMLFGGVLAILFSLLAGWWLAGAAVRPVRRAYEAQAGFAADASHELRTPLAFVRAGVETMAEGEPDLGGQVLNEIDYLTSLTERLLLLARSEREGLGLDRTAVDVGASCLGSVQRSRIALANAIEVSQGPATAALGDGPALEAAFDAILENVHAHGGGAADVTWSQEANRAVVTIADHGPGLPSGVDHHRVFERFFRADPSRTRDTGGAGLGLSLARTLVEAQGGSMWLEATPGGGLTAKISLPLA